MPQRLATTYLLPAVLLAALTCLVGTASAAEDARAQVHHELQVSIQPDTHRLIVQDRVSWPRGHDGLDKVPEGGIRFLLHANLDVKCTDAGFLVTEGPDPHVGETLSQGALRLRSWIVRHVDGAWPKEAVLPLHYEGVIHHPPRSEGEEYARSFARTPGTIGSEGVVLTRATWWVPYFGEDLLDFELVVNLPPGWNAVSQGERTMKVGGPRREYTGIGWRCVHPMEEVYLIANRFAVYERDAGDVKALAYLQKPDPGLAAKYLEATVQYVAMYSDLLGKYPFSKFALVENFWETGYGMPSFTLLGPSVIRLPFILHSSYPHEILHNWWGNSVYVDWQTGNWCEGLTAYLADHLIREGQGRGTDYRFNTLKKYRSYVRGTRDFPLTEFRSRHSGATEAVGYGKSLMLYHMLRQRLGDEVFARGLKAFYAKHVWTQASFEDLAAVFSKVAQADLTPFFDQWVKRTGAPALALTASLGPGGELVAEVRQTQEGAPYALTVPLAITLRGEARARVVPVEMGDRAVRISMPLPMPIVRVDLDPEFDVFRRLDIAETPPTLSDLFGADVATLIVPSSEDPLAAGWRVFAQTWARGAGGQAEVVAEDEIERLPPKGAVWVLGSRNRWQRELASGLDAFSAGAGRARIDFGEAQLLRRGASFVYAVRHPVDAERVLGWVGTDVAKALAGLARKLPHYGRYSYLGFEGEAPDNVVKGQWPTTASPLTVILGQDAAGGVPMRAALPKREPLARLAPVFDAATLIGHVRHLASDGMNGRGVGDPELEQASAMIAVLFEEAGLEPGGADGTYWQTFTEPGGPGGKPVTLRNVVGILSGTNPAWSKQSVVVGAHYDHLGRGWPDVHKGDEGAIHNGADDNASGVAVLLELARVLGAGDAPARSVVFVAFTGEEWGRKGSRQYVRAMQRLPAAEAIGMVNLDTVGRLEGKPLMLLGSGTATEWRHIAMGVGYTTGVESKCVPEDPQGSDQVSFHEIGVPAVQLFSGAHTDYHRPTDDVEKIDAEGLVKVAVFAREVVAYLGGRAEPLTSTLGSSAGTASPVPERQPGTARRVSLGTVPDFAHQGPGVKVSSVVEGSAAEAAGIQAGDVLLAVDGESLEGLRHYSQVLKRHAVGDTIKILIRRGGEEMEVGATLKAR